MSRKTAELIEAREAHQAAYFAAGDWASDLDLASDGPHRLDWLRFRVAHEYFYPAQALGECGQQYRDLARHKQMQRHEFPAICQLEDAGLLNLVAGQPAPGPAIYCSFHLGAWAIQPVLLIRRGISMAIVAGPGMAQDHGGSMVRMNQLALERGWCDADLKVICSDGTSAAVQMMRDLRAGRSLYICVDGQRGHGGQLGADADPRHVVPVDFNGRRIHVRMGAAFLAHKLGLPLVPMVSWRGLDGSVSVEIGDAIDPQGEVHAFAQQSLQAMWQFFERRAQPHSTQWEMGWYNYRTRIQNSTETDAQARQQVRFNDSRYHFYAPSQGLLLDERTDELKRVPPAYAHLMAKLRKIREGVPSQWLQAQFKDPSIFNHLLANELLVAQ